MAKSGKERQADLAARNRAAGRSERKVWAHREDWAQILKYVARLNRKREVQRKIRANVEDWPEIESLVESLKHKREENETWPTTQ